MQRYIYFHFNLKFLKHVICSTSILLEMKYHKTLEELMPFASSLKEIEVYNFSMCGALFTSSEWRAYI